MCVCVCVRNLLSGHYIGRFGGVLLWTSGRCKRRLGVAYLGLWCWCSSGESLRSNIAVLHVGTGRQLLGRVDDVHRHCVRDLDAWWCWSYGWSRCSTKVGTLHVLWGRSSLPVVSSTSVGGGTVIPSPDGWKPYLFAPYSTTFTLPVSST
uniref:Uncharacterized protein n=1 Tax=Anopheles culicifacies TaxID=139723 RepID=A0A182MR83_9DIPT